jgi:hypothetical protein
MSGGNIARNDVNAIGETRVSTASVRVQTYTYERRGNKEKKNTDTVAGKERNVHCSRHYPRIRNVSKCSKCIPLPTLLLLRARSSISPLI